MKTPFREQLKRHGFHHPAVLNAIEAVPREQFVPENLATEAYADSPLPIGFGQTISQPFIVAYMTWKLQVSPDDRVLEVGTGSGYQAAVLSRLVREVISVEIVPELAGRAFETLMKLDITNVTVLHRNGQEGCPELAPYDAVMVTAASPEIPGALVDQLKVGGRLIIPVGDPHAPQQLRILTKALDGNHTVDDLLAVRFVPLTGKKKLV